MKKNIYLLGTGGTIAGVHQNPLATCGYRPASLTVEQILASLPGLGRIADIHGEQFAQIASENITPELWLKLARRVNEIAAAPDADGIVITHGTDTLEETAYFLNLTVHTEKPVVLVGAMRPATAIGADGSLNLYNAVLAASSPHTVGRGVMVLMNDMLISARDAEKSNTTRVDAFLPREMGTLGYVINGETEIFYEPLRKHTVHSEFHAESIAALPPVGIVYSYAGADPGMIRYLTENGVRGIIFDGTGNSSLPTNIRRAVQEAVSSGICVVRSSRCGGVVTRNGEVNDDEFGTVAAERLSAQKSRILLMLALTRTEDPHEIQRIFMEY